MTIGKKRYKLKALNPAKISAIIFAPFTPKICGIVDLVFPSYTKSRISKEEN